MRVTRLFGLLGAVVGPAAVFAGALRLLTPEPVVGERGVTLDGVANRHRDAEVVVIGASYANTDIDPVTLADKLDPGGPSVLVLQVGASAAPVWYAILKERVFGNGIEPKHIVLPVSITTALMTRLSPSQESKLTDQMPIPDDVVARRSYGARQFPALERLLGNRGAVRDPLLHAFRNAVPRWLLGVESAAVESAGTAVFGEQHDEADARVFSIVGDEDEEEDSGRSAARGWTVDDPDESYLSDIADLADANDARLALVLPPTIKGKDYGQVAAPEVEARVIAWAERRGVALLDYRGLPWDQSRFRDGRHMRKEAAKEFTAMIAADLLRAGGGGGLAVVGADRLVVRSGTPPTLPDVRWIPAGEPCSGTIPVPGFAFLGKKATAELFPRLISPIRVWEGESPLGTTLKKGECTGTAVHRAAFAVSRRQADGPPLVLRWAEEVPLGPAEEPIYWVFPGTTLTWSLDAPWRTPPTSVELTASALGPGTGLAELEVGGARVPIQVAGSDASATVPAPAGDGWTVAVSSPVDGPYLVLRTLAVRAGEATMSLVAPPRPRRLELLHKDAWTVVGNPPPLPSFTPRSEGGASWFEMPWRAAGDCSPLRVEHAGALLPKMPPGRRREGMGTRHTQNKLTFDALPGTDPLRDYTVVYDPDRRCPKLCRECLEEVWLDPGDTLTAEVPARRRMAFAADLFRLRLSITMDQRPADPAATLGVRVTLGDEVLATRALVPAEFGPMIDIPLSSPVAPGAPGALRVTYVSDPALPPVMVMSSLEDQ